MKIYLTAIIQSKPQHVNTLKGLLLALVSHSTKEEACLQYELHQSVEDENIFIFHETWKNQEGLDLHHQQPHLIAFGNDTAEIITGPVVIYKTKRVI